MCKLHVPSGRIVAVSFFIPLTNKVDKNKLIRYKDEIQKNLLFDVELYSDLEKEGYWVQSFPIFVTRKGK